jgi:hypothetical protein
MSNRNRAMYPVGSRVPEIEKVIKGNKQLKKRYGMYVAIKQAQGHSFFEEYSIDTRTFKPDDKEMLDHVLYGAALPDIEGKRLIAYHVTDDPHVMDTLTSGRSLTIKHKGMRQDIGPGFYASSSPEYWKGRSTRRYDPIRNLDRDQRILVAALIKKWEIDIQGYLTSSEKESLKNSLSRYIETGQLYEIEFAFGQPYNVSVEKLIEGLGLKQYNPYILEIEIKGKFFDLVHKIESSFADLFNVIAIAWFDKHYAGMKGSINLGFIYYKFLNDFGFSGMFQRGFYYSPQIVIWKRQAITNAKLTRASRFNLP